jgi:hypothetical protein
MVVERQGGGGGCNFHPLTDLSGLSRTDGQSEALAGKVVHGYRPPHLYIGSIHEYSDAHDPHSSVR